MVASAESQNLHGAQAACGQTSSIIPPWRSTHNFTEEANAHNHRNLLAVRRVFGLVQGRNALNFQQAGFERAAEEHEQAARDEVHVAVVQATLMFRAEMRERTVNRATRPPKNWKTLAGEIRRRPYAKNRILGHRGRLERFGSERLTPCYVRNLKLLLLALRFTNSENKCGDHTDRLRETRRRNTDLCCAASHSKITMTLRRDHKRFRWK